MHHLLAGLKSLVSESMMTTIDIARRSCGGAGYQSNSGFTELHSAMSPVPTYEGDNTVMLLQSARFVFKLVKKAQDGKPVPYPFEYFSKVKELMSIKGKGKKAEEFLNVDFLEQALAVRALVHVTKTVAAISESKLTNKVKDNEKFARMKLDMIKNHIDYVAFHLFRTHVDSSTFKDSRNKDLLMECFRINAIKSLSANSGALYEAGFFAGPADT